MGPKQIPSVTHNAATVTNKPKKGLWKKLRSATLGDASAPSSEQLAQARRQINNGVTQSFNAPRRASGGEVASSSFTCGSTNRDDAVRDLQRQHALLQRQHQLMKQLEEQEEMVQRQQQQHLQQQRRQLHTKSSNLRSNSRDLKSSRTDRDGVRSSSHDQTQAKSNRQQTSSHRQQRHRSSNNSDNSAAKALANLSMADGYQGHPSRQASISSGYEHSRRRSSMLSEDSYLYNDSGDDAYNQEMYSVLAEQPPPDRVNKSFTNKKPEYVPQSTNGNPFWFQDEPSATQAKEDYYEYCTDQDYMNRSATSQNVNSTNHASIGQTYVSSSKTGQGPVFTHDASVTNTYNTYAETPHVNEAECNQIPTGNVTIVHIDIQGSESLRQELPHDWIEAHDIYDIIIRRSYGEHHGYEVSSNGSAFILAFQNPIDALAFALEAQVKLYNYDSWPAGILKHPDAKDEPALKFKGLRAMIGIHHGPVDIRANALTGEPVYVGEAVEVAGNIGSLCHGGQILITSETWNAATSSSLGRPQVMDCGEHLLLETQGASGQTKKVCKHLLQLVPYGMAFDFGEARGRIESETSEVTIKTASSVYGRLFPPVPSKKQLSTSFLNAPYKNGRVTMCVVQAYGINKLSSNDINHNIKVLSKHIKRQLLFISPPGYESQAKNGLWVLAFDRLVNAVTFGLQLKSGLHKVSGLVGEIDIDCMFTVGIISGAFDSMSPNAVTGKAEYFGTIVNRTVAVATYCEPGNIYLGMPTADPPDFGATVKVELVEMKKLPDMKAATAIFSCRKRNVDMPYV